MPASRKDTSVVAITTTMVHFPSMAHDLLLDLGMSMNEARIYEAMITYGGSGASTIALRSKIHRRNTYDALYRLMEKGLVYEVIRQGETMYEAVTPEKLMEFVKEKEMRLSSALPHLLSVYRAHRAPQRAYMYKGVEGMKNFLRDALRVGKDMYEFGAKGGWFDPRLTTFVRRFLKEARKKGMKFHHIFDWEVQQKAPHVPGIVGKPYKFAPKKYTSDSAIEIFGDHVVTFTGLGFGTVEDDVTIFVMVSPRLAESYRLWWQMMWDLLPNPELKKNRKSKNVNTLS